MKRYLCDIYESLHELTWYFGCQDINGECCGDISFVEYRALRKISQETNPPIKLLKDALNVTKSGATRIIDRLETKGYAVRRHSHKDGRICCIELTEKGKFTVEEINNRYASFLGESLKDKELQTLSNINNTLNALVSALRQQGLGSIRK